MRTLEKLLLGLADHTDHIGEDHTRILHAAEAAGLLTRRLGRLIDRKHLPVEEVQSLLSHFHHTTGIAAQLRIDREGGLHIEPCLGTASPLHTLTGPGHPVHKAFEDLEALRTLVDAARQDLGYVRLVLLRAAPAGGPLDPYSEGQVLIVSSALDDETVHDVWSRVRLSTGYLGILQQLQETGPLRLVMPDVPCPDLADHYTRDGIVLADVVPITSVDEVLWYASGNSRHPLPDAHTAALAEQLAAAAPHLPRVEALLGLADHPAFA
jgi:hypothetical protein